MASVVRQTLAGVARAIAKATGGHRTHAGDARTIAKTTGVHKAHTSVVRGIANPDSGGRDRRGFIGPKKVPSPSPRYTTVNHRHQSMQEGAHVRVQRPKHKGSTNKPGTGDQVHLGVTSIIARSPSPYLILEPSQAFRIIWLDCCTGVHRAHAGVTRTIARATGDHREHASVARTIAKTTGVHRTHDGVARTIAKTTDVHRAHAGVARTIAKATVVHRAHAGVARTIAKTTGVHRAHASVARTFAKATGVHRTHTGVAANNKYC
jgi:hypothetical protein